MFRVKTASPGEGRLAVCREMVRSWIHRTELKAGRRVMASSGGVNTIHIVNSWFTLDMEQAIWWKGQELTGVVN